MVKQYVGARYVPKFASPVEWAADTSYEALTIVTFNNASYTSKVPVPPTVGNPANNPQYWALTGNYNAQVEEYRQTALQVKENLEEYRQTMEGVLPLISMTFPTVDDMIKSPAPQKGNCVITQGYYSVNDGGGAIYKIKLASNNTNSYTIRLNNGLDAELILLGDYVYAKQLGVSSSITGDENANKIIDGLNYAHRVILPNETIPCGTINIPRENTTLEGSSEFGEGSSTLNYTGNNYLIVNNKKSTTIKNLQINAQAGIGGIDDEIPVTAWGNNTLLENLIIYCGENSKYGVYVNDIACTINRCYTHGGTVGFNISSTDANLYNCAAEAAKEYGIKLGANSKATACIAASCGTYTSDPQKATGGFYVTATGIILNGCTTQQNPNAGVVIENANHAKIDVTSSGDGVNPWNTENTQGVLMRGNNYSCAVHVVALYYWEQGYNIKQGINIVGNNYNCDVQCIASKRDNEGNELFPAGKAAIQGNLTGTEVANLIENNGTYVVHANETSLTFEISAHNTDAPFILVVTGQIKSNIFVVSVLNGEVVYNTDTECINSITWDANNHKYTVGLANNNWGSVAIYYPGSLAPISIKFI